jgi:cytochrome c peroxidase
MPKALSSPIGQLIRRVVKDVRMRPLSDHILLQQFCEQRDEAAFATLLYRHGPMVLGVCRSVLRNDADVEDAFQATFLILARKAASIRKSASVGSWLHGVAHRTALKARAQSATREKNEAQAPARSATKPDDLAWKEVQQILHEELTGLAQRYRDPLVACYLEGKTQKEAAEQLRVAVSTLKERMERGRSLLRARLIGRGLGPTAILAAATWPAATSASVPVTLASNTIQAANLFAAGQAATTVASAQVAALTQGVLKAMLLTKVKLATVALVGMALMSGGTSLTMHAAPAGEPPTADRPFRAQGPKPEPGKPSPARPLHLPKEPYRYADLDLPVHFKTEFVQQLDNTPDSNPVTDHGATLGRVLFYETRLSANNTVSCSSCHLQKNAFSDPNRFSKGFAGKLTDRHAMSLANLRYYARGRFFWDERAGTLEEAVLLPIQSKAEMGQDLAQLVEILGKDEEYPALFKDAFGDRKVTRERIGQALAQFLRSMVSCRSKYDEGLAKVQSVRDDFPNFTVEENRGKALFVSNCAVCHLPGQDVSFFMIAPTNNGLDADYKNTDGGVGDLTLNARDIGRFKSPSLRNVEHTARYMHDGRFDTLDKVIDHYSKEVKPHPNLDGRMRQLDTARHLNFTDSEKAALIAFLRTLTDHKFLTDPKFSDPFR